MNPTTTSTRQEKPWGILTPNTRTFLPFLLLLLLLPTCTCDQSTIYGLLLEQPQDGENGYSSLVLALRTTGLDQVLADATSSMTFYAPNNKAFANFDLLELWSGDNYTAHVEHLLQRHVVPNQQFNADTVRASVETLAPESRISLRGTTLDNGSAEIVRGDLAASNGMLHGIDGILRDVYSYWTHQDYLDNMPGSSDYSILSQLLGTAYQSYGEVLTAITIFAPNNEAFYFHFSPTQLEELQQNPEAVLGAHVVEGNFPMEVLQSKSSLTFLDGYDQEIFAFGDELAIGPASVAAPKNVFLRNGMIYEIGVVLESTAAAEEEEVPNNGTGPTVSPTWLHENGAAFHTEAPTWSNPNSGTGPTDAPTWLHENGAAFHTGVPTWVGTGSGNIADEATIPTAEGGGDDYDNGTPEPTYVSTGDYMEYDEESFVVNCSQYEGRFEVASLNSGFVPHSVDYVIAEDEGTLQFRVTVQDQRWVALGFSKDGLMIGSVAVIGLPEEDPPVGIYDLGGYSQDEITPVEAQDALLLDASLTQNDTHTVLEFALVLEAMEGEWWIDPWGESQYVLLAAGRDNTFGYHAHRGSAGPISLQVCDDEEETDDTETEPIDESTPEPTSEGTGDIEETTDTASCTPPVDGSVYDVLSSRSEFSTFVETMPLELEEALQSCGNFTVFAPTNDALDSIDPDVFLRLFVDEDYMDQRNIVLASHVVPREEVVANEPVPTLAGLMINTGGNLVWLFGLGQYQVDTPSLVESLAYITATNGIIHGIDGVLMGDSIAEDPVAYALGGETMPTEDFAKLLQETALDEELIANGPITFFAPNNDGLASLGQENLDWLKDPTNLESMRQLLNHHIAAGIFSLQDLMDLESITMESGEILPVSTSMARQGTPTIRIGDTEVVPFDTYTSNGMMFAIKGVLVPELVEPQLPVTLSDDAATTPTTTAPSPATTAVSTSSLEDTLMPSAMGSAPNTEDMVYFTIDYDFETGPGREPSEEEIQELICKTNLFFRDEIRNYTSDSSVQSEATNIDWSYKPDDVLQFTLSFTAKVTYGYQEPVPLQTVVDAMEVTVTDITNYLQFYVWETSSNSVFQYAVSAAFSDYVDVPVPIGRLPFHNCASAEAPSVTPGTSDCPIGEGMCTADYNPVICGLCEYSNPCGATLAGFNPEIDCISANTVTPTAVAATEPPTVPPATGTTATAPPTTPTTAETEDERLDIFVKYVVSNDREITEPEAVNASGLSKAWPVFATEVVVSINAARTRRRLRAAPRRRLEVALEPGSASVNVIEKARCPAGSKESAICHDVTSSYTLLLQGGEDPSEVNKEYGMATAEGVNDGTYQAVLDRLDRRNPLTIGIIPEPEPDESGCTDRSDCDEGSFCSTSTNECETLNCANWVAGAPEGEVTYSGEPCTAEGAEPGLAFCGRDGSCYPYDCQNWFVYGPVEFTGYNTYDPVELSCSEYSSGGDENMNSVTFGCRVWKPGFRAPSAKSQTHHFNEECIASPQGNTEFKCYQNMPNTDYGDFVAAGARLDLTCDREIYDHEQPKFWYIVEARNDERDYMSGTGNTLSTDSFDDNLAGRTFFSLLQSVQDTPQPTFPGPSPVSSPTGDTPITTEKPVQPTSQPPGGFQNCTACDGLVNQEGSLPGGLSCTDWDYGVSLLEAGSADCLLERALGAEYCGCPAPEKPKSCHPCPGIELDSSKELPDARGLTCGSLKSLISVDEDTCDVIEQKYSSWCGCGNPSQGSCPFCETGEIENNSFIIPDIGNLTFYFRIFGHLADTSCQGLSDYYSVQTENSCKQAGASLVENIPYDMKAWCGCPSAAAPNICGDLCPAGTRLQENTIYDSEQGLNCGDLSRIYQYVTDEKVCGEAVKVKQTCCLNQKVMVDANFVVANQNGLQAAELASSDMGKTLGRAFEDFVATVVADTEGKQMQRFLRSARHLLATLQPHSTKITAVQNANCPEEAPQDSICQNVYGEFSLLVDDEKPSAVSSRYETAVEVAITDGTLQGSFDKVDPSFPFDVAGVAETVGGNVTINATFVVANQAGLGATELASPDNGNTLNRAFEDFVVTLVAETESTPSQRFLQATTRHLLATLQPDGTRILAVQNVNCPQEVPKDSLCQNVYGEFDLFAESETKQDVTSRYEAAVETAITDGKLQGSLDKVDPTFPFDVVGYVDTNNVPSSKDGKMSWWLILLITLASLFGCIGICFLFAYAATKKQEKSLATEEEIAERSAMTDASAPLLAADAKNPIHLEEDSEEDQFSEDQNGVEGRADTSQGSSGDWEESSEEGGSDKDWDGAEPRAVVEEDEYDSDEELVEKTMERGMPAMEQAPKLAVNVEDDSTSRKTDQYDDEDGREESDLSEEGEQGSMQGAQPRGLDRESDEIASRDPAEEDGSEGVEWSDDDAQESAGRLASSRNDQGEGLDETDGVEWSDDDIPDAARDASTRDDEAADHRGSAEKTEANQHPNIIPDSAKQQEQPPDDVASMALDSSGGSATDCSGKGEPTQAARSIAPDGFEHERAQEDVGTGVDPEEHIRGSGLAPAVALAAATMVATSQEEGGGEEEANETGDQGIDASFEDQSPMPPVSTEQKQVETSKESWEVDSSDEEEPPLPTNEGQGEPGRESWEVDSNDQEELPPATHSSIEDRAMAGKEAWEVDSDNGEELSPTNALIDGQGEVAKESWEVDSDDGEILPSSILVVEGQEQTDKESWEVDSNNGEELPPAATTAEDQVEVGKESWEVGSDGVEELQPVVSRENARASKESWEVDSEDEKDLPPPDPTHEQQVTTNRESWEVDSDGEELPLPTPSASELDRVNKESWEVDSNDDNKLLPVILAAEEMAKAGDESWEVDSDGGEGLPRTAPVIEAEAETGREPWEVDSDNQEDSMPPLPAGKESWEVDSDEVEDLPQALLAASEQPPEFMESLEVDSNEAQELPPAGPEGKDQVRVDESWEVDSDEAEDLPPVMLTGDEQPPEFMESLEVDSDEAQELPPAGPEGEDLDILDKESWEVDSDGAEGLPPAMLTGDEQPPECMESLVVDSSEAQELPPAGPEGKDQVRVDKESWEVDSDEAEDLPPVMITGDEQIPEFMESLEVDSDEAQELPPAGPEGGHQDILDKESWEVDSDGAEGLPPAMLTGDEQPPEFMESLFVDSSEAQELPPAGPEGEDQDILDKESWEVDSDEAEELPPPIPTLEEQAEAGKESWEVDSDDGEEMPVAALAAGAAVGVVTAAVVHNALDNDPDTPQEESPARVADSMEEDTEHSTKMEGNLADSPQSTSMVVESSPTAAGLQAEDSIGIPALAPFPSPSIGNSQEENMQDQMETPSNLLHADTPPPALVNGQLPPQQEEREEDNRPSLVAAAAPADLKDFEGDDSHEWDQECEDERLQLEQEHNTLLLEQAENSNNLATVGLAGPATIASPSPSENDDNWTTYSTHSIGVNAYRDAASTAPSEISRGSGRDSLEGFNYLASEMGGSSTNLDSSLLDNLGMDYSETTRGMTPPPPTGRSVTRESFGLGDLVRELESGLEDNDFEDSNEDLLNDDSDPMLEDNNALDLLQQELASVDSRQPSEVLSEMLLNDSEHLVDNGKNPWESNDEEEDLRLLPGTSSLTGSSPDSRRNWSYDQDDNEDWHDASSGLTPPRNRIAEPEEFATPQQYH